MFIGDALALTAEERPTLKSAPPMRIFPLAINGCSVNRQLSMTRPPSLTAEYFFWRQTWVDCHAPLKEHGP
jgi:hypothetical protein